MEYIRVPKVDNVHLLSKGIPRPGALHITPHHLIFRHYVQIPPTPNKSPSSPTDTPKSSKAVVPSPQAEVWITYPVIAQAIRSSTNASGYSSLRLRCKDFTFITFHFFVDKDCKDVFESVKALACKTATNSLYAFFYKPPPQEAKYNGWTLYKPEQEYLRMGIGQSTKAWRFSNINHDYKFCDSYPSVLVVPTCISDNTLKYVSKYRSRERIPALTYLHKLNNCTITRSAQPLVGVRGARSIQDEKLVAAIFSSSDANQMMGLYEQETGTSDDNVATETECSTTGTGNKKVYGAQQRNLIIDARPTVNAYAQQAIGAGTENMDNYENGGTCSKRYLGIDNIHTMRNSLLAVVEAIKDSDITPLSPNRELLQKSGWLKHISCVMEGTALIVKQVAIQHSHVLIHCSDGWDRTSQLSALAQLCLDPHYRTFKGFMVLVEKDWISFGHRFRDRIGIGSSEKSFAEKIINLPKDDLNEDDMSSGFQAGLGNALSQAKNFFGRKKEPEPEFEGPFAGDSSLGTNVPPPPVNERETSPTFHQFLDTVYQLLHQYPSRFEFNERFLRRLLYHVNSCQYGTFLFNNERERREANIASSTRSVWDYFLSRKHLFTNAHYNPGDDTREQGSWSVIVPDSQDVRWWWELWGRTDEEMNGQGSLDPAVTPPLVVPGLSERKSTETSVTIAPHLPPPQSTPVAQLVQQNQSSKKVPTGTSIATSRPSVVTLESLAVGSDDEDSSAVASGSQREELSPQDAAASLNTTSLVANSNSNMDPLSGAIDVVQGGLAGLKLGVQALARKSSTRNASPARKVKESMDVEMM